MGDGAKAAAKAAAEEAEHLGRLESLARFSKYSPMEVLREKSPV